MGPGLAILFYGFFSVLLVISQVGSLFGGDRRDAVRGSPYRMSTTPEVGIHHLTIVDVLPPPGLRDER